MVLKFIKSERGGIILVHEGYAYYKKKVNATNITWRCRENRNRLCSATIHTTSDKRTGQIVDDEIPVHNHPADIINIEVKKVKEKIKKKAKKGCDNNSVLISNVLSNVPSPVRAQLPKIKSLTRAVQRAKKSDDQVVNPKTLEELVIPDLYKMTNNNELFLLHDSGSAADRFLIYATSKNLELLCECKSWFCDGTFNSVPLIFKQLYTIHGMYGDKVLPLVYILAPNKSEKIYSRALSVIKNRQKNLKPQRVMVDFERAFINAFKSKFPECIITGSFVPVDHVIDAFEEIIKSPFYEDNSDTLNEFIHYFERTWIGERSRIGSKRKKPLFDISLWNCYQAVIEDLMCTNNSVEGWHHSFNNKV
ncbi:uncharacterized protein LOC130673240 [Microplitis mediator]|uniref:uncharacterized protein LOC130673240 n=1 Tax=Microplitis mediator TaxID=375433 RepID=UPI002555C523|nr:uncharacterized protein LOC130673240 [Microplitis mediator]